ncbi:MAG: DUF2934 domain-containing protein [Alphaproteobacteria bacterium]
MTADRNARIQERAYHLWLDEGRPRGRHEEHWHRAERELIEEEGNLRENPAVGAPEPSVGTAPPLRTGNRQSPVAAKPAGVSRPRARSQVLDEAKADQPKAKPRTRSSRPASAGSGSGGSRRSAAAKPAG